MGKHEHDQVLVLLVKRNTHFIFLFSLDVSVLIINKCDSELSKTRVSDVGTRSSF